MTRTNKGHVAPDHVEQLRQLVNAGSPQPAAYTCDTRVVAPYLLDNCSVFENVHRSELENVERPTVESVALLPEESRPARIEFDERGCDEHQRQQRQKCRRCEDNVKAALGAKFGARQRPTPDFSSPRATDAG